MWPVIGVLVAFGLCLNVVFLLAVQSARSAHGTLRKPRAPKLAQSAQPVQDTLLGPAPTGPKYARPDASDYTVLTGEARGLREASQKLLGALRRCERQVRNPYGSGLTAFNDCVSVPIRVNIERAQFEPLILRDPLRNLDTGPCMMLAAFISDGFVNLGEGARAWMADMEAPASGATIRQDIDGLRQAATLALSGRITSGWRHACAPRAYDPTEHKYH